jgi:hypothetical protein
MKIRTFGVLFSILVYIFSCATHAQPLDKSQSFDKSKSAADDATRRLEDALSGGTGSNQNAAPVQTTSGGEQPGWVNAPYSNYSRDRYIAVVGAAANRSEAEKRAYAGIAAFFGQSVQTDLAVSTIYSEAVSNGVISVSENTDVREMIVTAASMDTLIGAEVGNVWDDRRGNVFALAYIEKEKTVVIYTELIRVNQKNIENLTSMNNAEKYTFNGYARYKLAALLAGMNKEYANIVSLSGGSTASLKMANQNDLTFETNNIIKNISVGFNVNGDLNNRVRDAFAKALSAEGLRTQGSNSPYTLDINIDTSEAVFPNNNFIFCRYTVSANLIERNTGSVLLPFNVSDREGHSTYEAAKARAFTAIEGAVADKYSAAFREYLAALLP